MKIYTLTCSNAYNYGAVLQTYALQRYLKNQGHDAIVIDYRPSYLRKISYKYKNNLFAKALRAILYAPDYSKSKMVFDEFKKNIKCSPRAYSTLEDLKELPEADLYIAGSDQIWNPYMKNGLDPAYYLEFVASGKVKSAYAASIGCSVSNEEYGAYYRKKLADFSTVTVRESATAIFLKKQGIQAECVLDPVYLLSALEWSELCEEAENTKYIVVYALHHVQAIYDYARELANACGVKMYVISVELKEIRRGNDKFFWNPSVGKFLSLIKNAEAVVTNSFHGISFGLIFNRPLHIFDTEVNDLRIKNIIETFELQTRVCEANRQIPYDNSLPDSLYEKIERKVLLSKVKLQEILENR